MKRGPMKKSNKHVPRIVAHDYPNVTKVTDAKESIAIEVIGADGKKGKRGDPTGCAMVRAVCREHDADAAIIGVGYSYVIKGNEAVRYKTPESVAREIVSFDRHDDFQPGQYSLSAVSPSNRLDRTKGSGRGGASDPNPHRPSGSKRRVIRGGSMGVRDLRSIK